MSEEQAKYTLTIESEDIDEVLFFGSARRYYLIISEIKDRFYQKWKWTHDKDWDAYDMLCDILSEYNFEDE